MPRGKKELAEQVIPKLREVEVEVGRGKTVANGGQEDRCDEAFDTLLEANGALRTVAAALQHDPNAQSPGIPAPQRAATDARKLPPPPPPRWLRMMPEAPRAAIVFVA